MRLDEITLTDLFDFANICKAPCGLDHFSVAALVSERPLFSTTVFWNNTCFIASTSLLDFICFLPNTLVDYNTFGRDMFQKDENISSFVELYLCHICIYIHGR